MIIVDLFTILLVFGKIKENQNVKRCVAIVPHSAFLFTMRYCSSRNTARIYYVEKKEVKSLRISPVF